MPGRPVSGCLSMLPELPDGIHVIADDPDLHLVPLAHAERRVELRLGLDQPAAAVLRIQLAAVGEGRAGFGVGLFHVLQIAEQGPQVGIRGHGQAVSVGRGPDEREPLLPQALEGVR